MFKKFYFDYMFYRFYQINGNKGGYQWIAASVIVSLIQSEFIAGIIIGFTRLIYERSSTAPHTKQITNAAVVLLIIIMAINFRRFHDKYPLFEEIWSSDSKRQRRLKGWLIIFSIILSFAPLIIIGVWF